LAEAAECVASVGGNQAYWGFLDEIIKLAPLNTPFDMTKLPASVGKFGDQKAIMDCIAAGTFKAKIQQEISDAVASGGTGTPHNILVNAKGKTTAISGSQPLEVVKQAIEANLK
jgi:protein-disulfide isomerase